MFALSSAGASRIPAMRSLELHVLEEQVAEQAVALDLGFDAFDLQPDRREPLEDLRLPHPQMG